MPLFFLSIPDLHKKANSSNPALSITQKLVKLVPDSWRRAPLQERKKGKRKRGKAGAREREGERKARRAKLCHLRAKHSGPDPPPPRPPIPNGEPARTLGAQRARATQMHYLWSSQLFSCRGKSRGRVRLGRGRGLRRPPRLRSRLSRRARGVGRRPHAGGPVVRKLPRSGLRAEREEACRSGREGSERAGWGRRAGGVGRAGPGNSSFPSLLPRARLVPLSPQKEDGW